MPGAKLGQEALDQLGEIAQRVLGSHVNEKADTSAGLRRSLPVWQFVKPTDGPDAQNYYQGFVVRWNETLTPPDWEELGGPNENIQIFTRPDPAVNVLQLDWIYAAMRVARGPQWNQTDEPLYCVSFGGGIAVEEEGAIKVDPCFLLTFESEDFDVTEPTAGNAFVTTQGVTTTSTVVVDPVTCATETWEFRRGLRVS